MHVMTTERRYRFLLVMILLAIVWLVDLPVEAGDGGGEGSLSPFVLGYLESAGVALTVPTLVRAAETNEDPTVRWAATTVLAERRVEDARQMFLRQLAHEKDPTVREAAAYGAGILGEPAGVAVLRELLVGSADLLQRVAAARALARLGHDDGLPLLVEILAVQPPGEEADEPSNVPETVRLNAVYALGPFFAQDATVDSSLPSPLELLLGASEDPAEHVRSAALTQISMLVYAGQIEVSDVQPTVDEMAISDPSPDVRSQARSLLAGWKTTAGTDGGQP